MQKPTSRTVPYSKSPQCAHYVDGDAVMRPIRDLGLQELASSQQTKLEKAISEAAAKDESLAFAALRDSERQAEESRDEADRQRTKLEEIPTKQSKPASTEPLAS